MTTPLAFGSFVLPFFISLFVALSLDLTILFWFLSSIACVASPCLALPCPDHVDMPTCAVSLVDLFGLFWLA